MELNMYINKYKLARYNFFKWRYELDIEFKLILAFSFACLTGLMAQVRFVLPWSPVPITGQTFAVLFSAVILGKWGGISQSMYFGLGAMGIPWFTGWAGGIGVITGATGGYIIGFVIAAFFLGYFVDKYIRSRSFLSMLSLMLFANFGIIHGIGLIQLYLWSSIVMGYSFGVWELLLMGTIPFIAGDLTKIFITAGIARGITPKTAYNGEVDAGKWKNWPLP